MEAVSNNFDAWMKLDPSPQSREELKELWNAEKWSQLDHLLNNRILFGTAGLRAPMGPGFAQMNSVTVLQASQGLASYVSQTLSGQLGTVVIGHDHRFHSQEFANIAAAVFLIRGFDVHFIGEGVCATPMVPFAVDLLNAKAGIMITASHNPKNDNGYKVYWANGCQIIPPMDSEIQDSILKNLSLWENFSWDTQSIFDRHSDRLHFCKDTVVPQYVAHLKNKLLTCDKIEGFQCIYTAMHGVGTEFVQVLMNSIAPNVLKYLSSQCTPDPNFPTVKFPNPEEKGALDLAIEHAEAIGCPLVVANDPDADRFSFAYKAKDVWKQFSGNEIGTLFGDYVISTYKGDLANMWLLNSTVSSQMLKTMAQKEGFHYADTLTGFKWIGNKAIDLERAGHQVPFAYEEAIGFMFPTVHDKDGISALLMFLQMYQWHLQTNTTPLDRLNTLYKKYGYFKECNGYFLTTRTNEIFNENIRSKGIPTSIGDWTVTSWRDLTTGYDSETADNIPLLPTDASSQMITAQVTKDATNVRFTLRGSGTEPKLKLYIEAISPIEKVAENAAKAVWDLLTMHFKLDAR